MKECLSCQLTTERFTKPVCENIFENSFWRIAHAYNTSLSGWLVIVALRHIETLADLTSEEAVSLGEMIRKTSKAVQQVTSAVKTYSIMFAEHPQHSHVHFHIVPRRADLPLEQRGGNIFQYLNVADDAIIPLEQRNDISSRVRALLLEPSF
jgi:diadenosine tetraphosphate (Ap4A) HIT family hydrolase